MLSQGLNFVETLAVVSFYTATAVVLSGIVSGIVALGIVQLRLRERIQRRELRGFFDVAAGSESSNAAVAMLMNPATSVLCRMYYRQIAGQLLAMATNEAMHRASGDAVDTPLLNALTGEPKAVSNSGDTASPPPGATADGTTRKVDTSHINAVGGEAKPAVRSGDTATLSSEARLDQATRRLDMLQARLGDAVSGAVMSATLVTWAVIYIAVAVTSALQIWPHASTFLSLSGVAHITAVVVLVVLFSGIAIVLAISAAAVALLTFGLLDRVVAAK